MTDSVDSFLSRTLAECPKHMEYGPCGGVAFDGSCEVSPLRCTFLATPTVRWNGVDRAGGSAAPVGRADAPASAVQPSAMQPPALQPPAVRPSAGATRMRRLLTQRQIVVADLPAKALDAASIAATGEALAGAVDAVLAGDSGRSRVQFPPTYRAHLVQQAGLEVWTGINCRDRNRVAIEGELAGLADVGVAGVLCVTGDHTLTGRRPDAAPVFDLDSTEVASLAAAAGHLVSVGESPLAPPVDRRAARLLEKQRAGAEICFVNHAGGAGPVDAFIRDARALGSTMSYIPCVPVVLDRGSAELLLSFTTLVLPDGYLEGILAAADPFAAGIESAVALCRELLVVDGVVGVNLSGGATAGDELHYAEGMAAIGIEVRR